MRGAPPAERPYLVRVQAEFWGASSPDYPAAGERSLVSEVDGIRLVVCRMPPEVVWRCPSFPRGRESLTAEFFIGSFGKSAARSCSSDLFYLLQLPVCPHRPTDKTARPSDHRRLPTGCRTARVIYTNTGKSGISHRTIGSCVQPKRLTAILRSLAPNQ